MQLSPIYSLVLSILTIFSLSVTNLQAQGGRTGYVDYELLFESAAEAAQVEQKLVADKKKLETSLAGKQSDFDKKVNAYYASSEADAVAKATKQKHYQDANQMARELQDARLSAESTLKTKEKQLKSELEAKIRIAIQKVAAQKGFSAVLPLQETLYCSDSDNLTSAVLEEIKTR
jgi:Skp family chaperone for outer membrane proteins